MGNPGAEFQKATQRILAAFLLATAIVPTAAAQARSTSPSPTPPIDAHRHRPQAPPLDIGHLRDPFASYLEKRTPRGDRGRSGLRLPPHKHEVLEDFALSALKLVAVMRIGKKRVAMVEDPSGNGHLVHVGNYMGKNGGRIKKITDDSILLVEYVPAPGGGLRKRRAVLSLKAPNP